jgi:hypothetical protein
LKLSKKEEMMSNIEKFDRFSGGAKKFDETVLVKVLERKLNTDSDPIVEHLYENNEGQVPIRNICAKITADLYDQISDYCNLLGISKRRFIEAALIAALDRVEQIIRERGLSLEGQE